jgi:hypothetical protein
MISGYVYSKQISVIKQVLKAISESKLGSKILKRLLARPEI